VAVGIETRGHDVGRPDIAATQGSAGPGDEIRDAVLRDEPLVKVFVAGEHRVDVTFDENRLERNPQGTSAGAVSPGRVERIVHVDDFPLGA